MKKNSGNALFFILIAIFLLGGLTVLLTRQSGTTEDTGSTEQLSVQASEILRYGASLQQGVNSLISRGCSEGQISFWTDTNADGLETVADTYFNATSPADKSCHIFNERGAGRTLMAPKDAWEDQTQSAQPGFGVMYFSSMRVRGVGRDDGTLRSADMTMIVPFVTRDLCLRVNSVSGLPAQASGEPPVEDTGVFRTSPFTGTFTASGDLDSGASTPNTILNRQKIGCVQSATGGSYFNGGYHIYYMLLTR